MVNEPITDLRHADAGGLKNVSFAIERITRETHVGKDCFLFFAWVWVFNVLCSPLVACAHHVLCIHNARERILWTYLVKPSPHDFSRLLWEVTPFSCLRVAVLVWCRNE